MSDVEPVYLRMIAGLNRLKSSTFNNINFANNGNKTSKSALSGHNSVTPVQEGYFV